MGMDIGKIGLKRLCNKKEQDNWEDLQEKLLQEHKMLEKENKVKKMIKNPLVISIWLHLNKLLLSSLVLDQKLEQF